MNYATVLAEIKAGHIQPIYLLHGEEAYLARQLEKAIVESLLAPEERDMNLVTLDHDPLPQELVNLIETVPFMGGKNVIIVRNAAMFKARKSNSEAELEPESKDHVDERLLKVLSDMPEYSHVLFIVADKADKRRKIYKVVEKHGIAVELTPLKPNEVKVWLQSKLLELHKKMDSEALEYFLAVVSIMPQISLGFLDSEVEKMALYTGNKLVISKPTLQEVLAALPEVNIFAMTDALSQKHVKKALELLEQQIAMGVYPLRILALLAHEVRRLWQVKDMVDQGYSSQEVAKVLKLPSFVGEKLIKQSRSFTTETLKQAMLSLAAADHELKSGQAGNSVLETIMIEMCR
ncbi:MAG TPA: DNA polymerase III subunit delta [Negativicutes bacterium]